MFEVTRACFLRVKACNLVYLEDIDGAVTCWRKIIDSAYKENGGKKNEKTDY